MTEERLDGMGRDAGCRCPPSVAWKQLALCDFKASKDSVLKSVLYRTVGSDLLIRLRVSSSLHPLTKRDTYKKEKITGLFFVAYIAIEIIKTCEDKHLSSQTNIVQTYVVLWHQKNPK